MFSRALVLTLVLAGGMAVAQSTLVGNCSLHCSTSGIPALVDAARNGDRAAALGLLAERADANQAEADGTTALHWAVHNDDDELVTRLLAAGAEVDAANDYGATPISEAAVMANVAVLTKLLDGFFESQRARDAGFPPSGRERPAGRAWRRRGWL